MKGAQVIMPLLKNKSKNQSALSNNPYWKNVEQKSHTLITDILKEKLPLTNLSKNLDLEQDKDYRTLLVDYRESYGDNSSFDPEQVAYEIAYEYLLIVVKSLVKTLKTFTCHDPEYMEEII